MVLYHFPVKAASGTPISGIIVSRDFISILHVYVQIKLGIAKIVKLTVSFQCFGTSIQYGVQSFTLIISAESDLLGLMSFY